MSATLALHTRLRTPPAWLPVAVLLFSASLWGLTWWPLKALGEQGLSGPMVSLLSYGVVGVVALPLLWRERMQWRQQWGLLLLVGALGGWGNAAFVSALVVGDVVRVMLLFYLAPVWSVLGGRLFLGEAVSPRRWCAVALAVGGAFLVVGGVKAFDSPLSAGDWLAVTAGMAFSGNNIAARAGQSISTLSKAAALFFGCGLVSLFLLALSPPTLSSLPPATPNLVLALLAFGFGWLVLVTLTWQWSVTHMEAGRSGVIAIAELVVALLTATWIGGESLSAFEALGGALIAVAAVLEATSSTPAAAPAAIHAQANL